MPPERRGIFQSDFSSRATKASKSLASGTEVRGRISK